jgi:hypothetical protein
MKDRARRDERETPNRKRPTTNDQRPATNDQRRSAKRPPGNRIPENLSAYSPQPRRVCDRCHNRPVNYSAKLATGAIVIP